MFCVKIVSKLGALTVASPFVILSVRCLLIFNIVLTSFLKNCVENLVL